MPPTWPLDRGRVGGLFRVPRVKGGRVRGSKFKTTRTGGTMAGRPSLLNDLLAEEICSAVASGLPIDNAADAAGIGRRTVYRWLARGRTYGEAIEEDDGEPDEADGPYWQFWQDIKKARASLMATGLDEIRKAAEEPRHWTAWAWILERRFPTVFGKTPADPDEAIPTSPDDVTGDTEREALLSEIDRLSERLAADSEPEPVE